MFIHRRNLLQKRRNESREYSIKIYLAISTMATLLRSSHQTSSLSQNSEPKVTNYLPQIKFHYNEYADYLDNNNNNNNNNNLDNDGDRGGPKPPEWSFSPNRDVSQTVNDRSTIVAASARSLSSIDKDDDSNGEQSIIWDEKWSEKSALSNYRQLSAVSVDNNNNVVVFHRGNRVWGTGTFDANEIFDKSKGPIGENVVVLFSGVNGSVISEWGKDMFYLPHGLHVDDFGNYWITDVAMHQVFKYNADDIADAILREKKGNYDDYRDGDKKIFEGNVSKKKKIIPSIILGEAFVPGNDDKRFCKPTAVAVENNGGDFFVSDGYCNARIIKFNSKGERILTWGRKTGFQDPRMHPRIPPNAFFVPHALAIAEEYGYIYVADREQGRVSCFHTNNGSFHKSYQNVDLIGTRIFSVAYNADKIYLVNGPGILDSGNNVRGFVIDIKNGDILSQFKPGQKYMDRPHDIALSKDGRYIYVVELDTHQIYKFLNVVNSTKQRQQQHQHRRKGGSVESDDKNSFENRKEILIFDNGEGEGEGEGDVANDSVDHTIRKGVTATTIILSLVTATVVLVAFCVAIAAIVARCRKRGCLLNVRRGMPKWDSERRENFRLSKLLETRKIKGKKFFDKRPNTRDFSKLNTEPETSDDENNLTKII